MYQKNPLLTEAHLFPYLIGAHVVARAANNFEDKELQRLAVEDPKLYKNLKKKRSKRYHKIATGGGVVAALIHKPVKAAIMKAAKKAAKKA